MLAACDQLVVIVVDLITLSIGCCRAPMWYSYALDKTSEVFQSILGGLYNPNYH